MKPSNKLALLAMFVVAADIVLTAAFWQHETNPVRLEIGNAAATTLQLLGLFVINHIRKTEFVPPQHKLVNAILGVIVLLYGTVLLSNIMLLAVGPVSTEGWETGYMMLGVVG